MFDPGEVDVVTGLPAGDLDRVRVGLRADTPVPTAQQLGFLVALDAAELVALNAPDPAPCPWAATEELAARARSVEVLTRKSQAAGLAAVHALYARVLADDAGYYRGTRPRADDFATDEVAAALAITRRTASIRIDDALDLAACPRTRALLAAGVLAYPAARALAQEVTRTPPELQARVETAVLDALGGADLPGLGALTPEQIDMAGTLRAEQCWQVGQAATRTRVITLARQVVLDLAIQLPVPEPSPTPVDVEAFPTTPGVMMLGAQVGEADGTIALANIHHHARALKNQPGETRSMGQLRVQAFTDLLTSRTNGTPGGPGGGPNSGGPGGGPVGPVPIQVQVQVQVTVDANGRVATPRYGLLHPDALPDLLHAATTTSGSVQVRTITAPACPGRHPHPTGDRHDRHDRHDPSPALDAAIRIRDNTCRFPGCTIPAGRCDLDHTLPWPHGPTCTCNLTYLCRHHHRLKTHSRWQLTNHGAGRLTWTTPTGRTIHTRPDP